MLALADCGSALAVLVCLYALLGAAPSRALVVPSLLVVGSVVVVAKLLGLYDRDELLLRKSTLDESSGVFQLATLYTLLVALLDRQLGHAQLLPRSLLALWSLMFCFTMIARWGARSS